MSEARVVELEEEFREVQRVLRTLDEVDDTVDYYSHVDAMRKIEWSILQELEKQ